MAWTDEMVEDLRKMWHEGLTTGEIGKRLGVSKNSIVGKVHRLGLSGRPSPIKKKDEPVKEKSETVKEEKAIKKAKPEKPVKEEKTPKPEIEAEIPELKEERIEIIRCSSKVEHPKKHHKVMLTDLDNHTCRWPIGDPKDENFHFCGKKIKIGQTYCEEHANIAYVKANKK